MHRPKSVGRALPGIAITIQNDAEEEVPFGTVGEICIKGPCVMKDHYKLPEMTAGAIRDGWLHTGDLGVMEPDSHFVDRKKDLIIRGGQNIYPADIEEALYSHPAIAEAAVVPQEDELMGEMPKAFVALKPACAAGCGRTPEATAQSTSLAARGASRAAPLRAPGEPRSREARCAP